MYTDRPRSAARTEEGQEQLRAYYIALGRFVDTYAHTELLTHLVLRWQTKTSSDIARAVFSGVRTNEALNYFRRLADVGIIQADEWTALMPIVDQLRLVTSRRNDILHHGATDVAQGGGLVTNEALALTAERIQSFPISPEILDDMTADLRKINAHFLTRHMGRPALRGTHPELDVVLTASWRYKSPEQAQSHQRRDDMNRTPRRQRKSSPP
jgi:hypothetical protein